MATIYYDSGSSRQEKNWVGVVELRDTSQRNKDSAIWFIQDQLNDKGYYVQNHSALRGDAYCFTFQVRAGSSPQQDWSEITETYRTLGLGTEDNVDLDQYRY